ncbi:MAG: hypothetical protein JXB30_08415 [Anaerolineae bacterium]|nr:hypothetical protein [Anaerolineae bacterium]
MLVVGWIQAAAGYLVELALPLFPNTQVILADSSRAMLAQAGERLGGIGGKQVQILPPIKSEGLPSQRGETRCQVITAVQSRHYLLPSQREQAVKACLIVLEGDGLFIAFENIRPLSERGIGIGLDRWGSFQRKSGRSSSVVAAHFQ